MIDSVAGTPVMVGRGAVSAVLLAAGLAALGGCDATPRAPDAATRPVVTELEPVPTPAAGGSGEPNLAIGPDGAIYLSWLEPTETGHALRFATLEGETWSEPRTILDRPDLFVNWADFPSLAVLPDGTLAAHWLQMSGPGTYSYDVRMAFSRDGGASWGDDVIPHRDGVEAEHGFVSLVPMADDVAALWLDGRATPDGHPMTLRFATVAPDGVVDAAARLDADVCDCCQTAMARTTNGLVAAYRDRTADEVRDIYVARYADGAWTDGRPVHDDGWVIAGCPVNGPSLATQGDTVVVAWFTAAEAGAESADTAEEVRAAGERGRTLAAFSTDGGASFGPPVRVDDGSSMGRVDVALLAGTTAVVSWLERTGDGAEVRIRRVEPSEVGPGFTIAGAAAERATGFPRMMRAGDRLVFAWTASGEDGGVRTALGRLNSNVDGEGSEE